MVFKHEHSLSIGTASPLWEKPSAVGTQLGVQPVTLPLILLCSSSTAEAIYTLYVSLHCAHILLTIYNQLTSTERSADGFLHSLH